MDTIQGSMPALPARVYSIDILRGAAILLMILSSLEPFGSLPVWMYHAQTPPPSHNYNAFLPGLTWVDLVFPFFIFSMGAAIPFSLSKKLEQGMTNGIALWTVVKRGIFLLGFAIYAAHINPSAMAAGNGVGWHLLSTFFFCLMFAIWGRFPVKLSDKYNILIKCGGILTAAVIFYLLTFKGGESFSLFRNNIILFVLSNLAVAGGVVWIFTRNSHLARLGVMGIMMAIQLSSAQDGNWINALGDQYQIPCVAHFFKSNITAENLKYVSWLYDFSWIFRWGVLKYLYIIIPASIVGDMMYASLKSGNADDVRRHGDGGVVKVVLMAVILLATLCCLQARYVLTATIILSGLMVCGYWLFKNPSNPRQRLLFALYKWGAFWLILGLLFEPSQGGIKKDPSNMSYYFVTTALAIFSVIAFEILFDMCRNRGILNLFMYNGQNPMIAYIASPNFVLPLLAAVGLRKPLVGFYDAHPWGGFLLACIIVLAVSLGVSVFSRKKIFLRT